MLRNYKKQIVATWSILKYIIALLPILWIFSKVKIPDLGNALFRMAPWTFPLIIFISILSMALQGVKWWILVRAFTEKLTLIRAMAYHFSSSFYSLILPNSTAQEVVRTLFITKTAGAAVSWGSAWIGKITGLCISVAFSLYGLMILSDSKLPVNISIIIWVFFLIILLSIGLSFSKKFTRPIRAVMATRIPLKYLNKVEDIREGIYQYKNKKRELLVVILITLVTQVLFLVAMIATIKGITGSLFVNECIAFMPLIELVSMAQPLTPNGIGVRETLTAIMFKNIGLSNEQLSLFVIVTLSTNLPKLIGLIPVIYGTLKAKKK